MNSLLRQGLWVSTSGRAGLIVVIVLALLALASGLGLLAQDWARTGAEQWAAMSPDHWFGTNRLGQDIRDRALASTATAFRIGGFVTLGALALGALLGGISGWRQGGLIDDLVLWLMGVIDSIPIYLLAAALAYALGGSEAAMYLAMTLSFWTGTARLVRAEVGRLRQQDFIAAARAIGLPFRLILVRHLLPNAAHILLIQASLTFVAAIKTEVILSFLGIGVHDGVSWGLMLAESTQDVLAGHLGNFLAASLLLFALLLGLNLMADALQEAFGPGEAPT